MVWKPTKRTQVLAVAGYGVFIIGLGVAARLTGFTKPTTPMTPQASADTSRVAPAHEPDSLDRVAFARDLQTAYLNGGFDAKVRVTGQGGRVLRIDYLLASRVFAHEMEQAESFWRRLDRLQFSRVELIGYDYTNAWQPGPGKWGWASGRPEDQ